MSQKLAQPINQMRITVGYKHPWYPKNQKGLIHYGVDATYTNRKSTVLYALGKGKVTHCGNDRVCGNVVVVVYEDCLCTDGVTRNLAVRYFHMASISVKVGQFVTLDTKLGHLGNTGKYTNGAHLHFEVDTDWKYPQYTPTLSADSNVLRATPKGYGDTTIDPVKALWSKRSHPENQSVMSPYTPDKDRNSSVAYKDLEYKEFR